MTRLASFSAPTLAALTCAYVLRRRGWRVAVRGAPPDHAGAILLRPATARLLCTLWNDTHGALLQGAHRLRARRVRWGGAPPTVVQQTGFVMALAPLLARLRARLDAGEERQPDWLIAADAAAAAPLGAMRRHGVRRAWIAQICLASGAPPDEAVLHQHGAAWFMLLPRGGGRAVLHSVGLGAQPAPPAELARLIAGTEAIAGPFPAMARLRAPAARPGLIAVGEAALGLDPLCGDGAGHALRGAWAVAEALQAAGDGDPAPALREYDAGLTVAFRRHLAACSAHYSYCGPAWAEEAPAGGLVEGLKTFASHGEEALRF